MSKSNNVGLAGCIGAFGMITIIMIIINLVIGGVCFDYSLWAIIGKDVPWYVDMLCGLIAGEVVMPLALILFLLHFFIVFPLIVL